MKNILIASLLFLTGCSAEFWETLAEPYTIQPVPYRTYYFYEYPDYVYYNRYSPYRPYFYPTPTTTVIVVNNKKTPTNQDNKGTTKRTETRRTSGVDRSTERKANPSERNQGEVRRSSNTDNRQ